MSLVKSMKLAMALMGLVAATVAVAGVVDVVLAVTQEVVCSGGVSLPLC